MAVEDLVPTEYSAGFVIQEIIETELEKGVRKARAKRGFAIVSDPHTGGPEPGRPALPIEECRMEREIRSATSR